MNEKGYVVLVRLCFVLCPFFEEGFSIEELSQWVFVIGEIWVFSVVLYFRIVFFLFVFLGMFQYGVLHLGQTLGSWSWFRGIHSCWHRSHLYPSMVSLILPISSWRLRFEYIIFKYNIMEVKYKYLYTH